MKSLIGSGWTPSYSWASSACSVSRALCREAMSGVSISTAQRLLLPLGSRNGVTVMPCALKNSARLGELLLRVAAQRQVPVAYVTGLQMRRAADLHAGSAKTDPRDAWVLADFARRNADHLAWVDIGDELLSALRVLNGRDVDLATDANRILGMLKTATPYNPQHQKAA